MFYVLSLISFTANVPRPWGADLLQSGTSLLSSWPDGKTVHSLPSAYGCKNDFWHLFANQLPRVYSRAITRPAVRWACVFIGQFAYWWHPTAL